MARIDWAVPVKPLEGFTASRIRVRKNGRSRGFTFVLNRQHVRSVAQMRIAFRPRDSLCFFVIVTGEAGVEHVHHWQIESVEPYHRFVSGVAVVVKGPGWCQDEIAGMHCGAFTVDSCVTAIAFDDETQGRRSMTVGRSIFSGQD